uniref:Uncharacterized protein n=1 Tax=Ditylenchus dipsaci TaxID=166011 RepID=A0A915D7F8_9BILA
MSAPPRKPTSNQERRQLVGLLPCNKDKFFTFPLNHEERLWRTGLELSGLHYIRILVDNGMSRGGNHCNGSKEAIKVNQPYPLAPGSNGRFAAKDEMIGT